MKKQFKIGLLGFGTIGAGVVETIQKNGELLEARTGIHLEVAKIADLDVVSDRGITVDPSILTTDAFSVVTDPEIDIIVELIGGTGIARTLILKAMENGKSVVTANKALLAEHWGELVSTSNKYNTDILYEASVGGGIPVIRALREGLVCNHIDTIYGILNGTCNYILTKMEREGILFDDVLAEAQANGFAEADPSLDIDGIDTSHKAAILASIAYGKPIPMSAIKVSGIRGIDIKDIRIAAELGYRIKLMAIIKDVNDAVEVGVCPALVPADHQLAAVSGVFNAVMIKGDIVDETLYYGRGAGRLPTASAVVGDIVDAALNQTFDARLRVPPFSEHDYYDKILPSDEVETRYYLRMTLLNKPGVVAKVAKIMGDNNISIASLIQKESNEAHASVIILTHKAKQKQYTKAIAEVDAMEEVGAPTISFRVETFMA
ncbi:MAG: homoserine dehydrogenase [Spartobacteria bacterium]|nr:homoserine dehydrogenase [Spartobacteria bacterium]